MDLNDLREKDNGTLELELQAKHKHLFALRSQAVTEKLEDPSQLRKTKREIAQLKTLLRERQIAEQKIAAEKKAKDEPKQQEQPAAAAQ